MARRNQFLARSCGFLDALLGGAVVMVLAACGSLATPGPQSSVISSSPPSASAPLASTKTINASATLPANVASPPDWQSRWDKLVAAAKQEAQLVISVGAGQLYRQHALEFQKKYPEIAMEVNSQNPQDLIARIIPERQTGKYLWDVHTGAVGVYPLRDQGVFDPLRPALLPPEILDDGKWVDGFNAGFNDVNGQYLYSHSARMTFLFWVNRDLVSESTLNSVDQLLDPQWNGKIVTIDPRGPGAPKSHVAYLTLVKGEEFARKLLSQNLQIVAENRQATESVVRARQPIGFGINVADLVQFQRGGIGANVKPLAPDTEPGARLTTGLGTVGLINRAPHPNAAMLFVNWLLSKEAAEHWVNITGENTRRLDVSGGPTETTPKPGAYLKDVDREANYQLPIRAIEIAKEIIR